MGLGRTLGVDLGIADVMEDLARRGTPREAAERKIDATGGSKNLFIVVISLVVVVPQL